jgi:hypothetical protein
MDDTLAQLSLKFLKTLTPSVAKQAKGQEILSDPALHIALHLIACTRHLRDSCEGGGGGGGGGSGGGGGGGSGGGSGSGGEGEGKKRKGASSMLSPLLSGLVALLGKLLMDR